jgi:hypothetical protein
MKAARDYSACSGRSIPTRRLRRLSGSACRRRRGKDPLLNGNYFTGSYPTNGWGDRPQAAVGLDERSSGDFTYIPVDADGDGQFDDYWLLLHGKIPGNYYYDGTDIIYALSSSAGSGQYDLATAFSAYWSGRSGSPLQPGPGLLALAPEEQTEAPAADGAGLPPEPGIAAEGTATANPAQAALPEGAHALGRPARAGLWVLRGVELVRMRLPGSAAPQSEGDTEISQVKAWIPGQEDAPPVDIWSFGFDSD